MKFSILINQVKAVEWELNISQAVLFSYCFELPSWAEAQVLGSDIFYYSSKNKIINELPLLTDKPDTVYRLLKQLEEKKLIILKKLGAKDFIKLTSLCKEWSTEKNPVSDNFPGLFGNKSENPTDNFPTDNNTIYNKETIIQGASPKKEKNSEETKVETKSREQKLYETKIQFFKWIVDFVKKNPDKYPKKMYVEFARYWLESTPGGNKLRFQAEKFFEMGRRLSTWFTNANEKNKIGEMWEVEPSTPALDRQLKNLLKTEDATN